jgi:predicted DNA-binding protein
MMNMANKIRGARDIVRSSVSFSHEIYNSLEEMADSKKVSIAWVVREAVETYLEEQKGHFDKEPDTQNA